MRFLTDESCDFAAVEALRASGHDVTAVAEFARGEEDSVVIELALTRQRMLARQQGRPFKPRRLAVKQFGRSDAYLCQLL